MSESNSLVIFTKAAVMLAEADTVLKAKELKDVSITAAEWAKRKGMGDEAISHCRSYALEAERRMGQLIKAGKESGEVRSVGRHSNSTHQEELKIRDLGISFKESASAQAVAELPDEVFAEVKAGEKSKTKAVGDIKRNKNRKKREDDLKDRAKPLNGVGKFPVILCDPPWRYEHVETESRAIENQYPTMTAQELAALPINDIALSDCVMFMWATSPKLDKAIDLLRAWGFSYRTCAVWDKEKIGMGYYYRQQHELLLVATKGKPITPAPANRPSSVIRSPRGKHSEKPVQVYEQIEAMYRELPKVEMFARNVREGWAAWGNES